MSMPQCKFFFVPKTHAGAILYPGPNCRPLAKMKIMPLKKDLLFDQFTGLRFFIISQKFDNVNAGWVVIDLHGLF